MFWENAVEYLRNIDCYSFQTFAIVFSTTDNLLVGISGALGMKRKLLSKQKCVLRKCCGVSQKQCESWSFQTFAIVFSTPEKLLVEISGALWMKESHFLS